jgi:hypothetical protein
VKPTRLLLLWLAVLLAIGIVLGALQALDVALPAYVSRVNWGLLLALLAWGCSMPFASKDCRLHALYDICLAAWHLVAGVTCD